ncbi:hypothetical protein [Myxococcus landrumensis]|uniref:Lipoprotein n=1 Tax=Myxococcus landrumensis TaxID=2813577 RepID=A0ABX7N8Y0_9BACT|nr:hypothetical protein [Myxococcus landrumus]QSQ12818.1 hypothetical protein JY572_31390 [Myxococcus landrumus]
MIRRPPLPFLAVFALLACLASRESLAQNAHTGMVSHGSHITVPSGTVDDWAIHVSPRDMGFEEPRSEKDNAFLKFECYVVQINQYTWQVVARYKMRPWEGEGLWHNGFANYLLVHK